MANFGHKISKSSLYSETIGLEENISDLYFRYKVYLYPALNIENELEGRNTGEKGIN